LQDLYDSLDVPDTDVRSAWNLVNPSASSTINKDAALAFLHILANRHEGNRIPRTVPASLRSSFEKRQIDYRLGDDAQSKAASRWGVKADDSTTTGRKAKFGDQYLTRLGKGGYSGTTGTDFSTEKTEDWEEVRLRRQLAEMDDKIRRIEADGDARRRGGAKRDSKPALVKRELEKMLDYKRGQLRDLEEGKDGGAGEGGAAGLRRAGDDLALVKEQVEGLEAHLAARTQELERLRELIDAEKTGR
jgi:actin cytoskeleton-regulatory complex protein END3